MSSVTQQEMLEALAEVWALSPDVRLGQLFAHLGFLGEDQLSRRLAEIEDNELLDVLNRHRAELTARMPDGQSPENSASVYRNAALLESVATVAELWHSTDPQAWEESLNRYWQFVRPSHLSLERQLDNLALSRIAQLDEQGWYNFLLNEFFRWKYTAPNRFATTTRSLRQYMESGDLGVLHRIKEQLLTLDQTDIRAALVIASQIKGLGTAGASGLLALMYPGAFATVDQFLVKALQEIPGLSSAEALATMNPLQLSIGDGVLLIEILRDKAVENNRLFNVTCWTPRKIDKILWTYGR